MRRDPPADEALLAAYVDGVAELSADERRAIEARLAQDGDGALRAEAEATREIIGQLRELPRRERAPRGGAEPDWAALERSILDAVGPDVPRPWWRRLGWRWAVPVAALAVGAAVAALVLRAPERGSEPAPAVARPEPARPGRSPAAQEPAPEEGDRGETMALWLDGEDIEIDLAAEALPDAPWEGDHNLEDLLPASDLAWVDDLADDELDRAEALLQDPALQLPVRRKRS